MLLAVKNDCQECRALMLFVLKNVRSTSLSPCAFLDAGSGHERQAAGSFRSQSNRIVLTLCQAARQRLLSLTTSKLSVA